MLETREIKEIKKIEELKKIWENQGTLTDIISQMLRLWNSAGNQGN